MQMGLVKNEARQPQRAPMYKCIFIKMCMYYKQTQ